MTLDNSHSKSSDVGIVLPHFTYGVGVDYFFLGFDQALIFYNPKYLDLAASALHSGVVSGP